MAVDLEFTRRANLDLEEIENYLRREAGSQTANDMVNRILHTVDLLLAHPKLGRPRDDLAAHRRGLICAPYLIIYRLKEKRALTTVIVTRIVHGARDLPGLKLS